MLAWVVIAPTSPRETSLFAPGSAHPAVNPLESHPCAISQDNSPKITSLRNPPRGGVRRHLPPAPSAAPSPLDSALANVYENKQLQTQQIPHLRETWGRGSGSRTPIFLRPTSDLATCNLRTFKPATFRRPC